MKGCDNIFPMLYIKRDVNISKTYSFFMGFSVDNEINIIKRKMEDFTHFKDDFGTILIICKEI